MTKTTGKKRKYNFLDKKGTTKTRQDYIETSYVDGVKDKDGNCVIRPMSADEKAWLSQFISETEHGNLNNTKQVKAEVSKLRALRREHRAAKKAESIVEMVELESAIDEKLQYIELLRQSCNNFYTTEEEVLEIYARDNTRRRDVYNNAKISDNLIMYDISEYDKFTTEAISDVNPEDLVLEHLDFVPKSKRWK